MVEKLNLNRAVEIQPYNLPGTPGQGHLNWYSHRIIRIEPQDLMFHTLYYVILFLDPIIQYLGY